MTENPTGVSVVIPVYGRIVELLRAVHSVEGDPAWIEIIVEEPHWHYVPVAYSPL